MPLTHITNRNSVAYNQAASVKASVRKMAKTVLNQDGKKSDHAKVDDLVELRSFKPAKQKVIDTLTGAGKNTNSLTGWAEKSGDELKRLSITKKTGNGDESYGFKQLENGTKEYTAPSGDGRSIKVLETSNGTLLMGEAEPSKPNAGNTTLYGTLKFEDGQLVPVSNSSSGELKKPKPPADPLSTIRSNLQENPHHALHGELRWVDGKLVQA